MVHASDVFGDGRARGNEGSHLRPCLSRLFDSNTTAFSCQEW